MIYEKSKICDNCNSNFTAKSKAAKFCSKECRAIFNKNRKYEGKNEGVDYIVCKWCGTKCERIYGQHLKLSHPDKSKDDYKLEFPNAPLYCDRDKENFSKSSGLHMKKTKYRKMFSDKIKGDNNPNHKTNTTIDERKERSPYSITFYTSKGYSKEEAEEIISEYANMEKRRTTNLSYWLEETNGDIKKAELLLKDRQDTFSLDKCIEKYGKDEGAKRWQNRQNLWKSKVFNKNTHIGRGSSKISSDLFDVISNIIKEDDFNILEGKDEKFIHDGKQAYKYDFTIIDNKKIIEFNGDYWHCNPEIYESTYYHKVKKKTACELWEYDNYKYKLAKSHGYDILVVWENDYVKDPQTIIQKCLDFIYDI